MPEPSKPDLKNILREEQKEKLSPIDKDFYENVRKHIQELGIELKSMDPGSIKYQILEDELNKAKKNYNSILETRMAKINYEASVRKSLKLKDDREPENMTQEERDLYTGLYDLMSTFRNKCLDVSAQAKARDPAQAAAPEPKKKTRSAPNIKDYIMVRILHDIPTFAGMDGKNYTLAREDVATVPVVNANALILRGAALKIKMGRTE